MEELKKRLSKMMNELIAKHNMSMYGEKLQGDVYSVTETETGVDVVYNDEHVGYLLAGYVAESAWDEMDEKFKELGFEMVDSDGNMAVLERIV